MLFPSVKNNQECTHSYHLYVYHAQVIKNIHEKCNNTITVALLYLCHGTLRERKRDSERERCYLSGTGGIVSSKRAYVWIPESTSSFVWSDTVFLITLEPASILVPETLVLWLI